MFASHSRFFKLIRYVMSGGTGAITDLVLLFLLVHFGIHYLIAATIAFVLATGVSFTMQKFWTFKNNQLEKIHLQIPLFTTVALVNIAINTLLMFIFVSKLHIWYLLAQVLASGLIAIYSFFVYKFLVFEHTFFNQKTNL